MPDSLSLDLQHLSLPELQRFGRSSSDNYLLVRGELRTRHHRMLERFFINTDGILQLLNETASVISGFFALNYWTGDKGWDDADIHIYVPFRYFEVVRDYIIKTEGYRRDPEKDTRHDMHLVKRGCGQVRESLPDCNMAGIVCSSSSFVSKEYSPFYIVANQPGTRDCDMGAMKDSPMELSGLSILLLVFGMCRELLQNQKLL